METANGPDKDMGPAPANSLFVLLYIDFIMNLFYYSLAICYLLY